MKWSNSLSSFKTLLRCFAALVVVIAINPLSKSWASSKCDVKIFIADLSYPNVTHNSGTSVREAHRRSDRRKPITDGSLSRSFLEFALNTEKALLDAVKADLCTVRTSNSPFSVELVFIKFDLFASKSSIDYLRTKLVGIRSSYVDIVVNQKQRSMKATVMWNPRRMLRDQLILEGFNFKENGPVLPITGTEFHKFIGAFKYQVLRAPSLDVAKLRAAALKGTAR